MGKAFTWGLAFAALAALVAYVPPTMVPAEAGTPSWLFFDGVCNLCDGFVNFVADGDSQRRVQFGAIQKHTELLAQRGAPTDLSTVVLVQGGAFYTRSDAALRTLALLDQPWRSLAVLSIIPRPLRDYAYATVGANRYRMFGKTESCRVPTGDFKSRFLGYKPEAPAFAAAAAAAAPAAAASAAADSTDSAAAAAAAFDLAGLAIKRTGTHEQLESSSGGSGSSFRIHYEYPAGTAISPWHDIPLRVARPVFESDATTPLYHFVCEIPKGTTAKMEIIKDEPHNPIAQDTKKGKLRFYKYHPEVGSLVNYGALSQTWEDPDDKHPDTGAGGDNDPVDVLQINARPCAMGEVMPVRVLGTLALVDGGETDWKLIVVDARDPATQRMADIGDVPEAKVSAMREWFRLYKTAEGKGENEFGLGGKAMDAAYAVKVVEETHRQWKALHDEKTRACEHDGNACWM